VEAIALCVGKEGVYASLEDAALTATSIEQAMSCRQGWPALLARRIAPKTFQSFTKTSVSKIPSSKHF